MPINVREHARVKTDVRKIGGGASTTKRTHGGSFWTDAGNWLENAYKETRPFLQGAVELGKKAAPMLI